MTFCIITHVSHGAEKEGYFAYAPYVREMNIWLKHVDKVIVVAPLELKEKEPIDITYQHSHIDFKEVSEFNLIGLSSKWKMLLRMPKILGTTYKAMKKADHIHLRCPGNMGLLGCFVQLFFPKKPKTAKYAGNWDPKSLQPYSYRLQKWILSNTFLTKNMQVLVYGEWENSTKNIKPFFTASYFEKDKIVVAPRAFDGIISFLFVGTLSNGKQPLYAIQLVEQLFKNGKNVRLSLYGEGHERTMLEKYILDNNLAAIVSLEGNHNQEVIKKAYLENHFVVLPSLSEGWPKVVAEAMFWGCLPIASKVSCVPNMLDNGDRGLLLIMNLQADAQRIEGLLDNPERYQTKVKNAMDWSRRYTLDMFENEIKRVLQS